MGDISYNALMFVSADVMSVSAVGLCAVLFSFSVRIFYIG